MFTLRDKTILLTGGTGFLGKVIIERLLRTAPDIGRIYLLIRPQPNPATSRVGVLTRFDTEILTSGVFEALARMHGGQWAAFARDKLVPIAGDVSMPGLGLADPDYAALAASTDIIINAAASVAFDQPIDQAIRHNTRSVAQIAGFARACRSAVLVHVSTAYVAGRRTGTIAEAPLRSDIAPAELAAIDDLVAGVLRKAAEEGWDERTTRAGLTQEGMSRAKHLGWHDSYTYTKALGEMVLERERGDVPTAIVRPTIIESSLRDPEPGWLENLNVGDPIWVEYGRGRMPDFPFGLDAVYDMVPVDFVANAILAVLPRLADASDISYYAVGSGALNPLTGRQIYELTYEYFTRHPMHDRRGQPIAARRLTFPTHERFREMYADEARRSATMKRLLYLADLYESYMNGGSVFDTTNTQRLFDGMDATNRALLGFDVRQIDWRHYIQEVHLPGLRRHVLGDGRGHRVVRSHV